MQTFINVFRWSFVPVIAISFLCLILFARWETDLEISIPKSTGTIEGISVMQSVRSPLWNPPTLPDYSEHRDEMNRYATELPLAMPENARIKQFVMWDRMLEDAFLCVWRGLVVISLIYFCFRFRHRDRILDIVSCSTIGICAFMLIAIFFGGWWPDSSVASIIMGALIGFVIGLLAPHIRHIKQNDEREAAERGFDG